MLGLVLEHPNALQLRMEQGPYAAYSPRCVSACGRCISAPLIAAYLQQKSFLPYLVTCIAWCQGSCGVEICFASGRWIQHKKHQRHQVWGRLCIYCYRHIPICFFFGFEMCSWGRILVHSVIMKREILIFAVALEQ